MSTKKEKKVVVPAPAPIPLPKVTTEYALNSLEEVHNLRNATSYGLEVGDVFYRVVKYVITKTIKTEGSSMMEVGARPTKSYWSNSKPVL